MCWLCDHPGATERDYQEYMRELIGTFGWAVQGVERDGIHPPWAYTVGLTPRRRPELVITGMDLSQATQVLNAVAAHLVHALPPEPGTRAALRDGPLVEVVRVAAPWAHLNLAVEFYGQRIRGLQLVHADERGRAGRGTTPTRACPAGSRCWVPGSRLTAGGGPDSRASRPESWLFRRPGRRGQK